VQLDKVNALTLEPIRAVYIAPPEEWEDETSTFGVVVQSKGGVLEGRNLEKITVRSWSAPVVEPLPMAFSPIVVWRKFMDYHFKRVSDNTQSASFGGKKRVTVGYKFAPLICRDFRCSIFRYFEPDGSANSD